MIAGASCFPFSRSAKPREGALPMPIQTESPSRKSWRDVLPIHPAAELFPLMSPDELRALGDNIRKNGLTSPIVLWRANPKSTACLLDGRNRLDAVESSTGCPAIVGAPSIMAGEHFLACDKVTVLDKSVDPYAYVISANIHRRHLTAEQRRDLIAKLIKATPEKSDRQIAETVKASPTTAGTVRSEMEAKGDVSKLDTRRDSKGRKQPAKKKRTPAAPNNSNDDVQTVRQAAAKRIRALMAGQKPEASARDDVGPTSTAEIARKDSEIEELRNAKRRLEIKITGLEGEITELKTRCEPASAARCEICREKKRATQRSVFVCDFCAEIHQLETVKAAPPADNGLEIPACLDRRGARKGGAG
jgi:hypothetical protein